MKIRPVGGELLHADRRDEANKYIYIYIEENYTEYDHRFVF